MKNFIDSKLSPLRNKIVHGHEISQTSGAETGITKSKLLELLSVENIKDIYNDFWENIEIFLDLFKDLIVPEGVNLDPIFISDQITKNPKEAMKRIEKEVEEELKIKK